MVAILKRSSKWNIGRSKWGGRPADHPKRSQRGEESCERILNYAVTAESDQQIIPKPVYPSRKRAAQTAVAAQPPQTSSYRAVPSFNG